MSTQCLPTRSPRVFPLVPDLSALRDMLCPSAQKAKHNVKSERGGRPSYYTNALGPTIVPRFARRPPNFDPGSIRPGVSDLPAKVSGVNRPSHLLWCCPRARLARRMGFHDAGLHAP